MKIKKALRICAALTVSAAVLLIPAAENAGTVGTVISRAVTQSELEQKIRDNEAYIKELDAKISAIDADIADSTQLQDYYAEKLLKTQDQINLLNNRIYAKEQEIAAKEEEISAVANDIYEKEKTIKAKQMDMDILERQNNDNIYRFGQIIRAMYITDSDDYISILAGSADFYDVFVRSEIMKSASEQNLEFMHQLLDDIHKLGEENEQLKKDEEKLKYDKQVIETEKSNLEDDKKELDEQRREVYDLNYSFTEEYNAVSAQIADFERRQRDYAYLQQVSRDEIKKYENEIDELIKQAQRAASNKVIYQSGDWTWPLDSRFQLITTYFGYDAWRGGNHGGIDIGNAGIMGANVYAAKPGEVILTKTSYIPGYDYGMYIVIDHGGGYQTLYAHLSAIYVSVGQQVAAGSVIGAVGSTGWSTGPHLHFEIRQNGTRVNPLSFF